MPERLEALGLADNWTIKFAGGADALWTELAAAKKEKRGTVVFNWTPNFTDAEGFTLLNSRLTTMVAASLTVAMANADHQKAG